MAGIDHSIYSQQQAPDFLGGIEKGMRLSEMARAGKREQAQLDAAKKAKDLELISRTAGSIKDQSSYEQGLGFLQKQGVDVSGMSKVYNPEEVGMYRNAALSTLEQIGQANKDRDFNYGKEKDEKQLAYTKSQDAITNKLARDNFNKGLTRDNRDYEVQLANMGLTREQFEETKGQNNFNNDLRAKELALMERDKTFNQSAKQKFLDAKLAEMQTKARGQTPEQDKALQKRRNEYVSRYGSIQAEAEKLKNLIKEDGTAEVIGDHEGKLKTAIYSMAVDAAKMFDPESVARESEVKGYQEQLFTPGSSTTLDSTAIGLVDNFQKMIQERARREGLDSGDQSYINRLAQNTPARGPQESNSFIPEAQAAGSSFDNVLKAAPNMGPQDQSALQWASQNAQDPRAEQILMNLNSKYGGR